MRGRRYSTRAFFQMLFLLGMAATPVTSLRPDLYPSLSHTHSHPPLYTYYLFGSLCQRLYSHYFMSVLLLWHYETH